MAWAILIALGAIIVSWLDDHRKCPMCRYKYLDSTFHGYNTKWEHCHNCGYCTFENRYKQMREQADEQDANWPV